MAMTRRDWLGAAVGASAIPLLSEDLLALARRLRERGAGAALQALDAQQAELVGTIVELIIPTTDTPGARAAGVPQFIDFALAEWMDADERKRFMAGLADVDARATAAHGKVFVQCTPAQQTALLQVLDDEAAAARDAKRPDARENFFASLKSLTLSGYYTSEIGFTQELRQEIIPGRYEPCQLIISAQKGGM